MNKQQDSVLLSPCDSDFIILDDESDCLADLFQKESAAKIPSDTPKISVLIPMYNRKHYISHSINSVLAQTFQDFEIIVRDDGSTDGSAEFVEEKYAAEISSGKIKLRRNEKNIGEFLTDNRLITEAEGKYVMILHSDDMYLPNALENMYTAAEQFNADVAHSTRRFRSGSNITFEEISQPNFEPGTLLKLWADGRYVEEVTLVSDEPLERFREWDSGMHVDAPYNIFRRKFLVDNNIFFEDFCKGLAGGNRLFMLKWIMKAEVLVKTPEPFYIYRNAPDAISNSKFPSERITSFITAQMEMSRYLDDYFSKEDFFKDNVRRQCRVRYLLFHTMIDWLLRRNNVYKGAVTLEIDGAVEEAFKKYFGKDAAFPTFLFHAYNCLMYGRKATGIIPEKKAPPPKTN